MRGHWISQTRRLNKHYQSGGEQPDDYWSSFCSGSFGDFEHPSGTVVSYLTGTKWVWDNDLGRYRLSDRSTTSRIAAGEINITAFIQKAHMYRSAPGAYEMTAYADNTPSPPASPSLQDNFGGNTGINTSFFGSTRSFSGASDTSLLWRGMKYLKMTCPDYGYKKVNGVLQTFPVALDAEFNLNLLEAEMTRLMGQNTNAAKYSTRQLLDLRHVTYFTTPGTWSSSSTNGTLIDERQTHNRRTNQYSGWFNRGITEQVYDVSSNYNVQQQFRGTNMEGLVKYVGLKMFKYDNKTICWSVIPTFYDENFEVMSDDGKATGGGYEMYFFFDGVPITLLRMCPFHFNTNVGDIEYCSGENGTQQTTFSGRYRAFVVPRVDGLSKEEFEDMREEVDSQLRRVIYTAPT